MTHDIKLRGVLKNKYYSIIQPLDQDLWDEDDFIDKLHSGDWKLMERNEDTYNFIDTTDIEVEDLLDMEDDGKELILVAPVVWDGINVDKVTYYVSSDGHVFKYAQRSKSYRNMAEEHINITLNNKKQPTPCVQVSIKGDRQRLPISTLVWQSFADPKYIYRFVGYVDSNAMNIALGNLDGAYSSVGYATKYYDMYASGEEMDGIVKPSNEEYVAPEATKPATPRTKQQTLGLLIG